MPAATRQQIALVTGGSGGIGRAVCTELGRSGTYVVVNYRGNREGAEKTLEMVLAAAAAGRSAGSTSAIGKRWSGRYTRSATGWRPLTSWSTMPASSLTACS